MMALIDLAIYFFIIATNIVKYLAWFYFLFKLVSVGFAILTEGKINAEVLSKNRKNLTHIIIAMIVILFSYSIISGLHIIMSDITSQSGTTQIKDTPTDSITMNNKINNIAYNSEKDVFYINI